jgi:hypothetical protein
MTNLDLLQAGCIHTTKAKGSANIVTIHQENSSDFADNETARIMTLHGQGVDVETIAEKVYDRAMNDSPWGRIRCKTFGNLVERVKRIIRGNTQ